MVDDNRWDLLGKRVEYERLQRGWGKEEAARRAGISSITWKRVEDGLRVRDTKLNSVLASLNMQITYTDDDGRAVSVGAFAPPDDEETTDDDLAPAFDTAGGANGAAGYFHRLTAAQGAFESAIAAYLAAEREFETALRHWASVELQREAVRTALAAGQEDRGRALTEEERARLKAETPRPDPGEVGEWMAWGAAHEPREWTRYEMALIEGVLDYPQDPRIGSAIADLEPARTRVRRLGLSKEVEAHTGVPVRVEPIYSGIGLSPEQSPDATDELGDESRVARYLERATNLARELHAQQPESGGRRDD